MDVISNENHFPNIMQIIRSKYPESFWFTLLLYGMAAMICYGHTLESSFHFDDYKDIVDNLAIRDITSVSAWWNYTSSRPIAMLSFALNYHFHGLDIRGFHIVNILIHIINALLVFSITRLMLTSPKLEEHQLSQHRHIVALLAGLFFLVHPLQTQAVTYIVQRMASLATLFYLSSLFAYIRARRSRHAPGQIGFFSICFTFAILGMLTKQIVFTLPFVIVLYEFTFESTFSDLTKKTRLAIGFALFVLLFIVPAIHKYDFSLITRTIEPQQAMRESITASSYLITQFRVLITYLRLFILPIEQQLDYNYAISSNIGEPAVLLSLLALAGLLTYAIVRFRHNRLLSFGIFWFFLCLAVESSFIPLPNVIFEHRMYLPITGLIWATLALIFTSIRPYRSRIRAISVGLVATTFIGMTHQRNLVWQSEATLWNDEIKKEPENPRAWASRSTVYFRENQFDKALSDLNKALELNPYYTIALQNRGIIHLRMQNYEAALADFNAILTANPLNIAALGSRASTYMELGQYKNAIQDLSIALLQQPNEPDILSTYGKALHFAGDDSAAIDQFTRILGAAPTNTEALTFRARSYLRQKKYNQAAADLLKLINLQPANAGHHYQFANLCIYQGNYEQAVKHFTRAIDINPQFVQAYINRGNTYVVLGEHELAIEDFSNAIVVSPDYKNAFYNRSKVYYHLNDYHCALMDVQKCRELGYDVPQPYLTELLEKSKQSNPHRSTD